MSDTKTPAPSQQESSATTATGKCSIEGCDNEPRTYHGGQGPYCYLHERSEEWDFCFTCRAFCEPATEGNDVELCTKHGGQDYTPRTTADHPNPAPPEAKACDDGKEENTHRCCPGFDDIVTGPCPIQSCKGEFCGEDVYCERHEKMFECEWDFCAVCSRHSISEPRLCSIHGGKDYTPRTTDAPKTIAEELLSLGVAPLEPLTPEERAQDLVRWRRDIEEHNRGKEATK